MDILLRRGRVIHTHADDHSVFDRSADVLVRDGRIAEIGTGLSSPKHCQVVDASSYVVTPGLVDLHVHFREPGHEYKEDIATGCQAAASGGFTTVCCMPNTNPVNDCRAVTDLILRRAKQANGVRVYPIGAISRGLQGQRLAEFGEMQQAGIVAVSDDGRPIMNAGLMRRALEYAHTFGLPVVQHAEDLELAESGSMNEGEVSTRIGVRGQPAEAETVMVARDIELVANTRARYHVAHISASRTVSLVRDAKRRGLPVSCEVTPHHFTLTDESCAAYDTNTKVMPPLRTHRDLDAIKEGMADGTIDCIATDHAPHSDVEKQVEFSCAAPGMLGLETAVPLTLELVSEGVIDLAKAIQMLTMNPARLFSLHRQGVGTLREGAPADICIVDVDRQWSVDRSAVQSKSQNTPFHGRAMQGRAVMTLVQGKIVHDMLGVVHA